MFTENQRKKVMNNNVKWSLFTTNWGRTAVNTLELYRNNKLPNTSIELVIYENLPSGAFELAQEIGIPTERVIRKDFDSRLNYEKHLLMLMEKYSIDYIFLQGYSYLIKSVLLEKFKNKIVNIHPSLLPSFKGKRAIQQAIEYGVKYSGITTHFIDEFVDEGEIICQLPVQIIKGDEFASIDARYQKESFQIILDTFNTVNKS